VNENNFIKLKFIPISNWISN